MVSRFVCRLHVGGPSATSTSALATALGAGWHVKEWPGLTVGQRAFELPRAQHGLQIVGDVRLDNRAALLKELADTQNAETVTGLDLCLLAFQRWGSSCVRHLDGEFAFVIVDLESRAVFAARDVMGTRPLFYSECQGGLVLGSDFEAMKAVANEIGAAVNREALGDFVQTLPAWRGWCHQTAYADVFRVEGGATLTWTGGGVHLASSVELLPDAGGCRTSDDFVQRFLELFQRAVRKRMVGVRQPAIMVSGGLDSSAIACQLGADHRGGAAKPYLYSWIYPPGHSGDERTFVEAVGRTCDPAPLTTMRGESVFGLGPELSGERLTGPEIFINPLLFERMATRAVHEGADAVFTGEWSDEVVQASGYNLPQAFGELGIRTAFSDWHEYRRYSSPGRLLLEWLGRPIPQLIRNHRNRARGYLVPDGLSGFTPRRLWENVRGGKAALRTARHNAMERGTDVPWPLPFLDHQLVSHLLAVPLESRMRHGMTKVILREAMAGILPEVVRLRTAPANCNDTNYSGIRRESARIQQLLGSSRVVALGLLDSKDCEEITRLLSTPVAKVSSWRARVLRIVHVELWLRSSGAAG